MTDANSNDNAASMDGTGAGMMAWFAWMIKTHEVTENTASGLRTGVRNVLSVNEDWEEVDMTRLDVDAQLQRFRNAKRGTLSESSVEEYARRFRTCVESYRKWLEGDKDWSPVKVRSAGAAKKNAVKKPKQEPRQFDLGLRTPATVVKRGSDEAEKEPEDSAGLIRHTVPLRSGDDAVLYLPRELTPADARRVSRVISSLAMDDDEDDDSSPRPVRAIEA